jgi:hypothetical protein
MNSPVFAPARSFNLRVLLKRIHSLTTRPTRPQTNIECVVDIMQFNKSALYTQLFVMDVLKKHSIHVAAMTDAEADAISTVLITGRAWRDIAREVKAKLELHDRAPMHVAYKGDGDEY